MNTRHIVEGAAMAKKLTVWATSIGAVISVVLVLLGLAASGLMLKLFRAVNTVQKTLPTLKQAAEIYIQREREAQKERTTSY